MSGNVEQNTSRQAELMRCILEVRYTDMEAEKSLCKELLDLSEQEQYFYGSAFANVYLVDSHLALGEYGSCDFYLLRASHLCRENGFDDLLLILCNCAGLYYQKLNDDQSALTYFLEGGHLAEKLGDSAASGKIYNNIGYSFARCHDLTTAKKYFELAYQTVEADVETDAAGAAPHSAATYLTNLSEMCTLLGDTEGSLRALRLCDALNMSDVYSQVRQKCGWCSYYAAADEQGRCAEIVDDILATHLLETEDQFFICDMAEGLCGNMLDIGDLTRAKTLLEIMQSYEYDSSLSLRYRIQILKIRCWEAFGATEPLKQGYRDYYHLSMEMAQVEDETRAQSILSKMHIHQATKERASMQAQVQALENASQLDELTLLYNRRYFNKLVTKVTQSEDSHTLGFVMLDVDYFKQYNDYYGHFKGDDALRAVARALSTNAGDGIFVSRYGGDEFVCLCLNMSDDAVADFARRVAETLRDKAVPHEKNLVCGFLSVSIGYCNEPFVPGMEADQLLNLSDKALYEVKQRQRGGCARMTLD